MFYLGVLLIFLGFSPVSHYVDDLMYVKNQPNYNYNEYYYDDDYDHNDFLDFDHQDDQEHINTYQLSYLYGDDIVVNRSQTSAGSAIFGLLFIGLGAYLVVTNWKKPHNRSTFWKVIGGLVLFVGVTKVLSDTLEVGGFYFNSIPGRILIGLRYFIPGLLLIMYNRNEPQVSRSLPEQSVIVQTEEEPTPVVPNTPIERLIYKLEEAKQTKYSLEHPEIENTLSESIKVLKEIHRSDYNIDDDFLEKIANLTDSYLEIDGTSIQNQRSQELLGQIGETYNVIYEALENIYDSNFNEKANDIETDMVSFQTQLNLEGKLDSPFEKFKENYQSKED